MHYKYEENIFTRKVDEKDLLRYQEYKKNIDNKFKIDIFFISENKLIEFFELREHNFFLVYCFEKVKEWIFFNESYTEQYINKLEKILKNLRLLNKLNSFEHEYLNHVKAIVFSKKRNLKQLVTDFPFVNKNELICFNFTNSTIFELVEKQLLPKIEKCEIYLSNSRIIINQPSYIYSIHFEYIFSYKMENDLFRLDVYNEYNNDSMTHLYFDTNDNYVLYSSFQRVFNKF